MRKREMENENRLDLPVNITQLMIRVGSATEGHQLAVFVKSNGEVWCCFADTVLAKRLINLPPFGSKHVGNYWKANSEGEINNDIHRVHKSFKMRFK